MKIPLEKCFPNLYSALVAIKMDHVLDVQSCVHLALWFDVIISLIYGFIWFSDVLQIECLSCLAYQPIGTAIFFANAWIAGVLLASYDETGKLQEQLKGQHDDLNAETAIMSREAAAQNNKMSGLLVKNLLNELNQLIADMRTILPQAKRICAKALYRSLIDIMADRLIAIRKSAVVHFHLKEEYPPSHLFMRNLLMQGTDDSGQEFRARDVLDLRQHLTHRFFSSRTVTLKDAPPSTLTYAEQAMWPEDEMLEQQKDFRQGLQHGASAMGLMDPDKHKPGRLLDSPMCKSLVFGLVTNCLLLLFYCYTGSYLIMEMNDKDCGKLCWLDAVDGLVRKFIGIAACACQISAMIVIIWNLDKLDPILLMKQNIEALQDVKRSMEELNSLFVSGAKDNIEMGDVIHDVVEEKRMTAEFVRKLAAREGHNSLQAADFQELLEQLRRSSGVYNLPIGSASSQESAPLLQTETA